MGSIQRFVSATPDHEGGKIRYKCFINNNTKSNLSKYKKQLQTTYIT